MQFKWKGINLGGKTQQQPSNQLQPPARFIKHFNLLSYPVRMYIYRYCGYFYISKETRPLWRCIIHLFITGTLFGFSYFPAVPLVCTFHCWVHPSFSRHFVYFIWLIAGFKPSIPDSSSTSYIPLPAALRVAATMELQMASNGHSMFFFTTVSHANIHILLRSFRQISCSSDVTHFL